jgi:hypothetical protein
MPTTLQSCVAVIGTVEILSDCSSLSQHGYVLKADFRDIQLPVAKAFKIGTSVEPRQVILPGLGPSPSLNTVLTSIQFPSTDS